MREALAIRLDLIEARIQVNNVTIFDLLRIVPSVCNLFSLTTAFI